MTDTPKSFIVELNEAARTCSNADYRSELLLCATRLHALLGELAKLPTRETMQDVNSAWARAYLFLLALPPEADPEPPLAGAPEAARFAIAA